MENMFKDLNILLSDLNVFYRKLQNYHWNVKGKDFYEAHERLEKYYDDINEQIDELGEHILVLGGQPLATFKDYLEQTTLVEAKNEKQESCPIFGSVKEDLKTLVQEVIKIKEEADELKQYGTSALMDEYIINYGKKIWMIDQKMQ